MVSNLFRHVFQGTVTSYSILFYCFAYVSLNMLIYDFKLCKSIFQEVFNQPEYFFFKKRGIWTGYHNIAIAMVAIKQNIKSHRGSKIGKIIWYTRQVRNIKGTKNNSFQ